MKHNLNIGLTNGQHYALKEMKSGKNLFITGGAGTGKSFLIQQYRDYLEKIDKVAVVVAYTGLAASNVGGMTCHRFFHLNPQGPQINSKKPAAILKLTDVLIIDEISMLRCDFFDAIMLCVEQSNIERREKNLSDVQVIVTGDFYQLPPIIGSDSEDIALQKKYRSKRINKLFPFQSDYWNFKTIELKEIVRQDNIDFSEALNKIRIGDKEGLLWIDEHCQHVKHITDENIPNLYGSNTDVDRKNKTFLSRIFTQTYGPYKLEREGIVSDNSIRFPEELILKLGARVMILINDSGEKPRFVNGTFGTVVAQKTENSKDIFTICIDNEDRTLVDFGPMTVDTYEYKVTEDEDGNLKLIEDKIGSYTQYPFKLAWAITIHKSQGQTYNKVAINPANWEHGLLYVALSRVKDVNNLVVLGSLKGCQLAIEPIVEEFYKDPDAFKYNWYHEEYEREMLELAAKEKSDQKSSISTYSFQNFNSYNSLKTPVYRKYGFNTVEEYREFMKLYE